MAIYFEHADHPVIIPCFGTEVIVGSLDRYAVDLNAKSNLNLFESFEECLRTSFISSSFWVPTERLKHNCLGARINIVWDDVAQLARYGTNSIIPSSSHHPSIILQFGVRFLSSQYHPAFKMVVRANHGFSMFFHGGPELGGSS